MRDALAKTAKRSRQGRRNLFRAQRQHQFGPQAKKLRAGGPKAAKRLRSERATHSVGKVSYSGTQVYRGALDLTPLRGLQISPAQLNGQAALHAA